MGAPIKQAIAQPALPTGGQFSAGAGSIAAAGANGLQINQTTGRGVIDWRSFNIGAGASVAINNGTGATLNRVTGGQLSTIQGSLSATGSVYLVNPQGVVVGPGGQVLSGGSVVLSSRNIGNDAFMAGGSLTASGTSIGDVTNKGTVLARSGDVVIIGHSVTNTGSIEAANGMATLAAGNTVVLSPVGGSSGVVVASDPTATGDVTEAGQVKAAAAALTAAGGNVYTLAGSTGMVQATGAQTIDGHVYLTAPNGTVNVAGTVTAKNADGSGGTIIASGKTVTVAGTAILDASGTKGGTILVGVTAPQTGLADSTTIASGAQILAGGPLGGGYIETSGHTLGIGAATIRPGVAGTWLLDPSDLTIDQTTADTIADALNGSGYVQPSANNIIVNGTIGAGGHPWTNASATLTLTALTDITVNTGFTATGNLTLTAGRDITLNGSITGHHAVTLTSSRDINVNAAISTTGAEALSLTTTTVAANNINVNAGITASGVLTLSTLRDINIAASSPISGAATGNGAMTLNAGNSLIVGSSVTSAGQLSVTQGNVTYLGNAQFTINQPISADSILFNSGNSVEVGAAVSTTNNIQIYASSYIQVDQNVHVTSSAGGVSMNAQYYQLALETNSVITGHNDVTIGSSNGAFINNSGAGAVVSTNGHWRIYSVDPNSDTAGGLVAQYIQYNDGGAPSDGSFSTNTTPVQPTQNGFLYSTAPILKYSVQGTTVTKTYDGGTTATVPFSDIVVDSGTPLHTGDTLTVPGGGTVAGTFLQSHVGTQLGITVTDPSINRGGVPVFGYQDYNPAQSTGIIGEITPALLQVSVGGTTSKTYDGTSGALVNPSNITVSGWIAGEDAGGVNDHPSQVSSANFVTTGGVNSAQVATANKVTVNLEVSDFQPTGARITDYTFVTAAHVSDQVLHVSATGGSGSGAITAAPLTISLSGNPNKTIDGNTTYSVANNGTGLTSANYKVSGFVTGEGATINQAVGTFGASTAGIQTITAGLTSASFTATGGTDLFNYSYGGQVLTLVSFAQNVSGVGTIKAAASGPFQISFTGALSKTYDGSATVSPADLTANNITAGSFTVTGGPGDLVLHPTGNISVVFGTPNAGVQPFTLTANTAINSTTDHTFYTSTSTDLTALGALPSVILGQGTINPKILTGLAIASTAANRVYNGTLAATITGYSGLSTGVAGEGFTVNQTAGTFATADFGTGKTVTASLSNANYTPTGGALLTNYTLPTTATGNVGTVSKATLTAIITNNPTKVYNTATDTAGDNSNAGLQTANFTLLGFISGQSATVNNGVAGQYLNSNAGVRNMTATVAISDLVAGSGTSLTNYQIVDPAAGSGTITPFALNLSFGSNPAVAASKQYNNSSFIAFNTATIANAFSSDTANLVLHQGSGEYRNSGNTANDPNVGTNKPIQVDVPFTITGSAANNYTVNQPTGITAAITQAPLYVKIEKVYDGTNSANGSISGITYTLFGFANGDSGLVVFSGGTSGVTGVFSAATVDGVKTSVGGNAAMLSMAGFPALAGPKGADYALDTTTVGNGTNNATYGVIDVRPLNPSLDAQSKLQDGNTATTTSLAGHFHFNTVAGDTLSTNVTSGVYDSATAGAATSVTAQTASNTYTFGGGFDQDNYSTLPTQVVGSGTIYAVAGTTVINVIKIIKVYDQGGGLPSILTSGAYLYDTPLPSGATVTVNGGNYTTTNVGDNIPMHNVSLTLGGTFSGNYQLVNPYDGDPIGKITPLNLTLAGLTGVNRTYNGLFGATVTGTPTLSGVLSGDDVNLSGTGSYTFESKNVANGIAIDGSGFVIYGAAIGNYSLPLTGVASANITKATLTTSLSASKPYDGAATATGLAPTVTGVNGETATVNVSTGTYNGTHVVGTTTVTTAGTLASGNFVGSGGFLAGNYTLPTSITGTGSITPVTLTLSINTNPTKVYDGNNTATLVTGDFTHTALVGTDAITVNSAATSGATYNTADVATATTVGVAGLLIGTAVTFTSGQSTDYALTSTASGAGHITAKLLGVTLDAKTKVYDSNTSSTLTSADFHLTGLVGGQTTTINQTVGTYDTSAVGNATKTVTANLANANFNAGSGGFIASNYALPSSVANHVSSITAATLTVDLTNVTKVYDGTNALPTASSAYTLHGIQGGDVVNVASATGAYDSIHVGTGLAVSISAITLGGAQGSNYTIQAVPAHATIGTITVAPLTLAIIGAPSKVYDGTTASTLTAANYSLSGLKGADAATVTAAALAGATYNSPNVATASTLTLTGASAASSLTFSTGLASDYAISGTVSGAGTITPKQLVVSLGAKTKVYDANTNIALVAADFGLTGFIGAETTTLNQTVGTYDTPNVGNANKTVTAALSSSNFNAGSNGFIASNYSLPSSAANLVSSITAAALTINLTNITKVYDGSTVFPLPPTGYTLSGIQGTDTVNVATIAGAYDSPNVGTNIPVVVTGITLGGASAGNYILAAIPAHATIGTITPKPLTSVITGDPTKPFDGNTVATLKPTDYTVTGFVGGEGGGINQTVGTYGNPAVGPEGVTANLVAGNYVANSGTLLSNYILPTTAVGTGHIAAAGTTPVVVAPLTNVQNALTNAVAQLNIPMTDGLAVSIRNASFAVADVRTYIPYPAPGALSSWRNNGWGTLPIVIDDTTNYSEVQDDLGNQVVQSGAPVINSTEQVLLSGVKNKRWRITIPQYGNGPSLFAVGTIVAAQ